ncbi:hypothetical protein PIB30_032112 [Stylosanthes scabra]|uniref:Uncharacterized protein n=1 Tax=Stylosanthes scabra TaxID=79078 RepID=A0ABU6UAS6_9FABA|nr:hypothetical protein [Stylosanthes scabra]
MKEIYIEEWAIAALMCETNIRTSRDRGGKTLLRAMSKCLSLKVIVSPEASTLVNFISSSFGRLVHLYHQENNFPQLFLLLYKSQALLIMELLKQAEKRHCRDKPTQQELMKENSITNIIIIV